MKSVYIALVMFLSFSVLATEVSITELHEHPVRWWEPAFNYGSSCIGVESIIGTNQSWSRDGSRIQCVGNAIWGMNHFTQEMCGLAAMDMSSSSSGFLSGCYFWNPLWGCAQGYQQVTVSAGTTLLYTCNRL